MRQLFVSAAAAASLMPAVALAQSASDSSSDNTLRGIRIEANAGGDQFKSQGVHDRRFGYGATVGFDGIIGKRIVIGPEATYWKPNHDSRNCTNPTATSVRCDQEGRELGAAVRAGYLVTPALLVFAKGGYVNAAQSGTYSNTTGFYYLNGMMVGPGYSSYRRVHTDGYQAGGGVEYTLYRHVYVDAQYIYSHYDDHANRQRVMGGVGIRF